MYWLYLICFVNQIKNTDIASELYCPYTAFQTIEQLDRQISTCFDSIVKDFYNTKNSMIKHTYEFRLAGSVAEGGFSPRFYGSQKKTFEIDIEMLTFQIGPCENRCIEDVQGKPGFVRISLNPSNNCSNILKQNRRKPYRSMQIDKETILLSPEGFILTQQLKRYNLLKKFRIFEKDKRKDVIIGLKIFFSIALKVPYSDVFVSNLYRRITKSTAEAGLDLLIVGKTFTLSADFSIIISLESKSSFQKAWEQRKRNWPKNLTMLRDSLDFGYVIAKTSHADKENVNTTEMRLSFAHIERSLIKLRSPMQRLAYIIFKTIMYKWVLPIDQDSLSSYIAKTVMLWVCEEHPPDLHAFWGQKPRDVKNVVAFLLIHMTRYFCKGFLPNFFIPQINVLEFVSNGTLMAVVETLDKITANLDDFLATLDARTLINDLEQASDLAVHCMHNVKKWFSKDALTELKFQIDMIGNFGLLGLYDYFIFRTNFLEPVLTQL